VLWGGPVFMLIAALVALDMRGWTMTNRIAVPLGAASYSIYLIHPYVTGPAGKVATPHADLHT